MNKREFIKSAAVIAGATALPPSLFGCYPFSASASVTQDKSAEKVRNGVHRYLTPTRQ